MKFTQIITFTLIGTLVFVSCKRDKENEVKLKPASENFQITEELKYEKTILNWIEDDNSNFPSFSAKFNEEVNWTLKLTGLKSKAVKEFKGTSTEIKKENTIWDGASSNIYFFKQGELVDVELSIFGDNTYKGKDSIEVVKPKRYHRLEQNGIKYVGIDNFEGSDAIDELRAGYSPDQNDIEVEMRLDTNIVVSGNYSFYMTGNDINKNSWSGGINSARLMDFYTKSSIVNIIDSGVDPEKFYFNIFVYGTGKEGSALQIKIYELDDKVGGKTEEIKTRQDILDYVSEGGSIPTNVYDQTENDGYIYDLNVNWMGWKMVSVPYSKFIAGKDILAGGNGDRKKETFRIVGAALSLLSLPEGNKTELYIDNFFITQGGKFQR